ncbi:hypothetical protein AKJ16_DCAP20297 [Drosera capensis]
MTTTNVCDDRISWTKMGSGVFVDCGGSVCGDCGEMRLRLPPARLRPAAAAGASRVAMTGSGGFVYLSLTSARIIGWSTSDLLIESINTRLKSWTKTYEEMQLSVYL